MKYSRANQVLDSQKKTFEHTTKCFNNKQITEAQMDKIINTQNLKDISISLAMLVDIYAATHGVMMGGGTDDT